MVEWKREAVWWIALYPCRKGKIIQAIRFAIRLMCNEVILLHFTLGIAYFKHDHIKVCTWCTVLGMRNNDAIFIFFDSDGFKEIMPYDHFQPLPRYV